MDILARKTNLAFLITLQLFAAAPALAGNSLDIQGTINRPGVKLLVVDFYATWCKPCMDAIPKWRALREQYRDSGLRIVMVHTQDPNTQCGEGVSDFADDVICDDKGYAANWLRVEKNLPAAFLWSWQGNLLVNNGHFADVAFEAGNYFQQLPRVAVEVTQADGISPSVVLDLVRSELKRASKLTVVATAKERQTAARIRKESFKPGYTNKTRCGLGKEVSPNSFLHVNVQGTHKQILSLNLFSAESSCALAMVTVPFDVSEPLGTVSEAVDLMLSQLKRKKITMPAAMQTKLQTAGFGENLAVITMPTLPSMRPANIQFDLSGADINFLEAWESFIEQYEKTISIDEDESLSPALKLKSWEEFDEASQLNPPSSFLQAYEEIQRQRISRTREWRLIVKAADTREKTWQSLNRRYNQDIDKLERFRQLRDSTVSKEQKEAYQREFKMAYAPFFVERERRLQLILEQKKTPGLVPWTTMGIGVGIIGLGSYFGIQAHLDYQKINREKAGSHALATKATRNADIANICFGIGAAAISSGLLLWLYEYLDVSWDLEDARVTAASTTEQYTIMISGSF